MTNYKLIFQSKVLDEESVPEDTIERFFFGIPDQETIDNLIIFYHKKDYDFICGYPIKPCPDEF